MKEVVNVIIAAAVGYSTWTLSSVFVGSLIAIIIAALTSLLVFKTKLK